MIPATNPLRVRPALGLAVIAVVIVAAAVTVLAVVRGGDGHEVAESTSTTFATTFTNTGGDRPPAPWRAAAMPRSAVPAAYAAAWARARNHATCALLFPVDGPAMEGAKPTAEKTPDDNGWDIFLTSGAGSVEVLGLFDKSTRIDKAPDAPAYTRTWADGSVAKYAADVGAAAPGTFDPNSSPFEAVLTVPDQACAYRIYDTLGKTHLEQMFDRLRLFSG